MDFNYRIDDPYILYQLQRVVLLYDRNGVEATEDRIVRGESSASNPPAVVQVAHMAAG